MIPNGYSYGIIKISSGIKTYRKYKEDSIYIKVYNDSSDGNNIYQGNVDYFTYGIANQDNNPKRENMTLFNNKILYVTQHSDARRDYRLVFLQNKWQ